MAELEFARHRLNPRDRRPKFTCGDADLDEFYHIDSASYCLQLLSVTYTFELDGRVAAFFSLSNDSIHSSNSRQDTAYERVLAAVPSEKHFSSMPAVKIGRLGVAASLQGGGIGRLVLDYIKMQCCSKSNATGCRFITVDSYKSSVEFYAKNGFIFLSSQDKKSETRIMYFDLMEFSEQMSEMEAGAIELGHPLS